MSYDAKCYDIACAFLLDYPALNSEKDRDGLAQAIQDEIESWIATYSRIRESAKLDSAYQSELEHRAGCDERERVGVDPESEE